jgi:PadR family transcriptional regulator PadR
MTAEGFPADWLRGTLDLCILGVLAEGPSYGYAITQRLQAAGLGTIKGGTLYPLLTRLQSADMVVPVWHAGDGGPNRKYLELTNIGRAELARRREQWQQFSLIVNSLANTAEGR